MTILPVLLILVSALFHCTWNLICKTNQPSAGFFLLVSLVSAALLLPVSFPGYSAELFMGGRLWYYLLPSGLAQSLYYISLANAYRENQISLAYPLARSLPVIFIPAVNFLIRGETITTAAFGGMLLIGTGCLLIPTLKTKRNLFSFFISLPFLWIFLAALGTTAYTILDSQALKMLGMSTQFSRTYLSIFYMTCQSFLIIANLLIYIMLHKEERQQLKETVRLNKKSALKAGIFLTLAYLFVLRAMSEGVNVGYLSALRQASIPLGAILGIILLKEEKSTKKYLAIILVTAGLIITAIN